MEVGEYNGWIMSLAAQMALSIGVVNERLH